MSYRLLAPSVSEISLLKSRFVAVLSPLAEAEDFPSLYSQIKKDYPKADHYPYGYSCHGFLKSSDDGEPSGAAGRGIAALLEKKQLDEAALVVVRYFGGSKLGLPRLKRTFAQAASLAYLQASLAEVVKLKKIDAVCSYSDYETLKSLSGRLGFTLFDVSFSESVALSLGVSATIFPALEPYLRHLEKWSEAGSLETLKEIKNDSAQ